MNDINVNEEDVSGINNIATSEHRLIIKELENDKPEVPRMTEAEIENMYATTQTQVYVQRNDFLIPNILQMVKNKEIFDITPSYQRRLRWSDIKKSHLIESLLMNVPIPPIFLYEKEFAKYEVMDGQQRLKTIISFCNNEFKLRDLKKWAVLNKRTFSELPPKIQAGLLRRGLAAVIVLSESSRDEKSAMELRQYIFERLNTGGQRLNAQEVRNCIYSGYFNDILIRIARSKLFTYVWGIPPKESEEPQVVSRTLARNTLYSTMSDCQIVLRFFALSNIENYRFGMQSFLDQYMDQKRKATKGECEKLENEYLLTLQTALEIYDTRLFRLPNKKNELEGRRSVPLADAVLLSIYKRLDQAKKLVKHKEFIIRETLTLFDDPEKYNTIVGYGNTKADIERRLSIFDELMQKALDLKE